MSYHDIGQTIRAMLLADSAITNKVGTRIFSDHVPQGQSYPAILYHIIYEDQEVPLDCRITGFANATIQVEAIADVSSGGRPEANKLWYEINRVLCGYKGTSGDTPIRGIGASSGHFTLTDPPETGSDHYRFRTIQDFLVSYHYTETV